MNRIDKVFERLAAEQKKALIPFVTAGDPCLDSTEMIVLEMVKQGADIIELGMPFSDPLADGPTIQASALRALDGGVNTAQILELVKSLHQKIQTPIVAMGYYNPILQYGLEQFAKDAADAGVDGTIIADLPLEEADKWGACAEKYGICNIFLVAPTTPLERAKKIACKSRGFLYYVSVAGITGARTNLPADIVANIKALKAVSPVPVAVGFGVSQPEHVEMLSKVADGVIVGSAIVKIIERNLEKSQGHTLSFSIQGMAELGDFVGRLKEKT